jgi:hypothetical protein
MLGHGENQDKEQQRLTIRTQEVLASARLGRATYLKLVSPTMKNEDEHATRVPVPFRPMEGAIAAALP